MQRKNIIQFRSDIEIRPIEMKAGEVTKILVDGIEFCRKAEEAPAPAPLLPKQKEDKPPKGKTVGKYHGFPIRELVLLDFITILTDGKSHRTPELEKIIEKFYTVHGATHHIYVSKYLGYIKRQNVNLKTKYIGRKQGGSIKEYWLENKVLKEKAKNKSRIVYSDGKIPLTNSGKCDKRSM